MKFIEQMFTTLRDDLKQRDSFLASKIKYGDHAVEALVNMAVRDHQNLVKEVERIDHELEMLKEGHVLEQQQQSANTRDLIIRVVGWVIVIALALAGWVVR